MYRSNRSFHIPPGHTPCTPRAFDTFAVPGRREFDYQSLPGGGEFDPRVTGVGNLNCTHDFMWNLLRGGLSWGTRCWGDFRGKDCAFVANWLRGKGLNKLCAVFEGIQILILFFNIGYRLWIYECIKLCLQWNRIPVLAIQCNNKRLNRGKREWQRSITLTCHMCVN